MCRAFFTLRHPAVIAAVLMVLMIAWHWYPAGPQPVVFDDQTIDVSGMRRRYRLVTPASQEIHTHSPLIVALPGAGDSPRDMARYTGLDQLAVKHDCFIVYLEGRHLSWPPFVPPENPDYLVPDLELFDAVCDALVQHYRIDRARIYVVGISQGGAFVNLLVARRSNSIAAAVCHSGWLPKPLPELGVQASRKTPMLFVVGAEDRQAPPSLLKIAVERFRQEGHRVEYWEISGLGHGWCQEEGFNDRLWRFLAECHLEEGE